MKRRDRASILIFCVILMAAVGTIVLTTADLGRAAYRRQALVERDAKFDYSLDGLIAVYSRRIEYNDVIVPTTEEFDVGGLSYKVDLAAGTGARSRFVDLTVALDVPGYARKRSYALGNLGKVSPTWFGLGTDWDFTPAGTVTVNGDAYLGSDSVLGTNTATVSGSLYCQRTSLTATPTVSGRTYMGSRNLTPVLDDLTYAAAASTKTSGNQNPLIVAFVPLGLLQTLWYHSGNMTLNVAYTGQGTIFVKGNLTISNFKRTLGVDQAVIVVSGNVTVDASQFDGFLICDGKVTCTNASGLTVNGGIWANQLVQNCPSITVNFDPFFWNDPSNDARLRVPGMW